MNSIGNTRKSIFLSSAFSSMVDGVSRVAYPFSALMTEALEVTWGLGSCAVDFVNLRTLRKFDVRTF